MTDVIWPFFGNNIGCFSLYSILDWLILPPNLIISWSSKDSTWKCFSSLKHTFHHLLISFWKHLCWYILIIEDSLLCNRFMFWKLPRCVNLIWFDNVLEHSLEFEHYRNNSFHFWQRGYSFQSIKGGSPRWSKLVSKNVPLQGLRHICDNCPALFSLCHKNFRPWIHVDVCPSASAIPKSCDAWSAGLRLDDTYLHCSTPQISCIWCILFIAKTLLLF